MAIQDDLSIAILDILRSANLNCEIPNELTLERPKNREHGDFATSISLALAKPSGKNPREIAELIKKNLEARSDISSVEIAGPGFINITLNSQSQGSVISTILSATKKYGETKTFPDTKINLEFISANPTGPLHLGHTRWAAVGDALGRVLSAAGAEVTREFYINDRGVQMDLFGKSIQAAALGKSRPEDGYHGDYINDLAKEIVAKHPEILNLDEEAQAAAFRDFGYELQLKEQQDVLVRFGTRFDVWFSEKSLYENNFFWHCQDVLKSKGHVFELDGATWLRTTDFGDDKDRVMTKSDGSLTYFASDIAYHLDKFSRGFDRVINVWGADHHGYIARVKGALLACGVDAQRLTVALVQFAALFRGAEKVAMGKRSGEFVTLRDLRREVGNDAARFFYVLRKSDQHLDFDLDLAKSQSNDNPVYYVQYAHARVCSIFVQAKRDAQSLHSTPLSPLEGARELALMQRIGEFPELIQTAARELAPHLIAFYLRELAADFHAFYNAERILVEDAALSEARLALCAATRYTLANGLALLGVSAPERM